MNHIELATACLSVLLGISAAVPFFLRHDLHMKGAHHDEH